MTLANNVSRFPNRPVRNATMRVLFSDDGMDFCKFTDFGGPISPIVRRLASFRQKDTGDEAPNCNQKA
jgi:hypothetical protein